MPSYCEDGYSTTDIFEEIVPKYLNVVKICHDSSCNDVLYSNSRISCNTQNKCTLISFTEYKDKIQENFGDVDYNNPPYIFYTSDGMIYYFAGGQNGIAIAVDTNGRKGPNIEGKDFFCMSQVNNKLVGSSCSYQEFGKGTVLGYLINNGWKMDY